MRQANRNHVDGDGDGDGVIFGDDAYDFVRNTHLFHVFFAERQLRVEMIGDGIIRRGFIHDIHTLTRKWHSEVSDGFWS